jgi:dynein heavy chain
MKTMAISSSPYVKFLAADVNAWKIQLVRVQEILEQWTKVQIGWLYLWPIFSSEDIQRSMPQISQSFSSVDKIWRNIMIQTVTQPTVLEACQQGRLFENFLQCNSTIERI